MRNKDEQKVLMSGNDLMKYLRIGHSTLLRYREQQGMPFCLIDGKILYKKSTIDKWVDSKEQKVANNG